MSEYLLEAKVPLLIDGRFGIGLVCKETADFNKRAFSWMLSEERRGDLLVFHHRCMGDTPSYIYAW